MADSLDPLLLLYLQPLIGHGATRRCQLESLAGGDADSDLCDRFVLRVPYGQREFRWHVLFNQSTPEEPPEIVVGETDDWVDSTANGPALLPLRQWGRASDGLELERAVRSLLDLYRKQQKDLIASFQNERLQFEYSTFIAARDDIDCSVDPAGEGGGVSLECTVPIPVASSLTSQLAALASRAPTASAPVLCWRMRYSLGAEAPGLQVAASVSLKFPTGDPTWQLGGFEPTLPVWSAESCLMDYVPSAAAEFELALTAHIGYLMARKDCIRALVAHFGHPLEAEDSPQQPHAVASFLMEAPDEFNVVFIVNVGTGFPQVASHPAPPSSLEKCAPAH